MTSFKLNTANLADNITRYKSIQKECLIDVGSTYNLLKSTDSGWNDSNATSFLNVLKSDAYEIDNYFTNIDSLYKQLEQLKNSFEDLFFKYGCPKGATLFYNDNYYQTCISSLYNAIEYLTTALSYINSCHFQGNLPSIYKVYNIRNEITKLKIEIKNMINGIMAFKKSVEKIISDTQVEVDKIVPVELDIKEVSYNWRIIDPN